MGGVFVLNTAALLLRGDSWWGQVLPTAYCLLPTAYCLLPTAYLAYCLLPPLPTASTAYLAYCLHSLLPT